MAAEPALDPGDVESGLIETTRVSMLKVLGHLGRDVRGVIDTDLGQACNSSSACGLGRFDPRGEHDGSVTGLMAG